MHLVGLYYKKKYFVIKIFQSFFVHLLSATDTSKEIMRTNYVRSLMFVREVQAMMLKVERFFSNLRISTSDSTIQGVTGGTDQTSGECSLC